MTLLELAGLLSAGHQYSPSFASDSHTPRLAQY